MKPRKTDGWLQGIYEISATAKEEVGAVREDLCGRKFRYAKAGATALTPGKMTVAATLNADWVNETPAAAAVGAKTVAITHVAVGTDTLPEDYFKGGQLHVNDATGEGHWYPITHSTAVTATSTVLTLSLSEGLRVAITASSECTPVPSPFMATAISTTEESEPTGIPMVDVTAEYYYWSQVGGEAICLIAGTPAVGSMLTLSATAGALAAINATLDIDQPIVARMIQTAGVATEYKPVKLCFD